MRRAPSSVLFSIALHAAGALFVTNVVWHPVARVPSPHSSAVWITVPRPSAPIDPQEQMAEPPPDVAPPKPDESSGPAREALEREPEDRPVEATGDAETTRTVEATRTTEPSRTPNEISADSPAPPSRETAADLSEATQRAIKSALEDRERGESHRSFLFPGTIGEQRAFDEENRLRRQEAGLQAPLTAFDSPSKGRAGLKGESAFGERMRWVSDDCYQTIGTNNLFLFDAAKALYDSATTICVPVAARGDLFRSAKPAYLMSAEERADAAEHERRMERLRRPTTGAVFRPETPRSE